MFLMFLQKKSERGCDRGRGRGQFPARCEHFLARYGQFLACDTGKTAEKGVSLGEKKRKETEAASTKRARHRSLINRLISNT